LKIFRSESFGIDLISSNLRKNILTSFYFFGGSFVGLLLGIFTQPIFSRHLEPWDFAVIGYFNSIQNFFVPLFSLNFTFYFLSSYWDKNMAEGKSLSFHLNSLNITNTIMAFIAMILIILYFKVAKVSFPVYPFILLIITNLFFEKYKTYYLLNCRINKMGLYYFLFTVLHVMLNTGLGLFFVVGLNGGAVGRMLGQTLSILFLGILAINIFVKNKNYKFSLKIDFIAVKRALKFCCPLILGGYLYYPVSNIDKIFLERIGNTQEFGYYNLGSTIAGYLGTFFITLYMAFEPDFYKFTSERKIKEYSGLAIIYIAILIIVTTFSIFASRYIVAFLTSNRYLEATKYVNIIVISMCLYSIGDMFQQLFNSLKVNNLSLIRNSIMSVVSIILYLLFIKKMEFIGAAWAKVFIFAFYIIIGFILFIKRFSNQIRILIKDR
jgi:O-antigen/teichoic acid export membrane protein